MGDRANIAIEQGDGTRVWLYTHWLGYTSCRRSARAQAFNTEMMDDCLHNAARKQARLDQYQDRMTGSPQWAETVARHREEWLARAIGWASR